MKKAIFIIIFKSLFSNICYGQIETTMRFEDLVRKDSLLFWNGSPYTGQAIKFDGVKFDKTKIRFDGHYVKGRPNGHIKQWYINHKLEYDESYLSGLKNGIQTYYFENGKKQSEYNYNLGVISDGLQNEWDSTGNLSFQRLYKNGQAIKVEEFKNGVLSNISELKSELYPNGEKKSEGWTLNGKKNKSWTEYFDTGKKKSEGEYTDDYREGKWLEYDERGVAKIVNYKKGEVDYYAMSILKTFMKDKKSDIYSGLYYYTGKQGNPARLIYIECNIEDKEAPKYLYNNSIISEYDGRYISKIAAQDYEKYSSDTVYYSLKCKISTISLKTSQRNENRNLDLYTCYEIQIPIDIGINDIKGNKIKSSSFNWEFDTDGGLGRPKINRFGRSSDLMNNADFTRRFSQMIMSLIDFNEFSNKK